MRLITIFHGGAVFERCDAHCHDSKERKCNCICGGRFHGLGSTSQALFEAIVKHAPELLATLDMTDDSRTTLCTLAGLSAPPATWLKQPSLFRDDEGNRDAEKASE